MTSLAFMLALICADANAGTAGFDFLRIEPTAREAALGGAALARARSPLGFWYNPAHAPSTGSQRAHVGYLNYVAGIHLGSLGYAQPVNPELGVGLGIVYLNSGTMKRTNEHGEELGAFSSSYADLDLSASYRIIDRLTIGLGLQGLYGSIDTFFSLGVAGNLGAVAALPVAGLHAGLAVRNLGLQVQPFGTSRDPLPLELGVGLGYSPVDAVDLMLDVRRPLDNDIAVRMGVEGRVGQYLILRAGYNSTGSQWKSGSGADVLAGLTTGLGVRYRGYELDYCFIPMVQLGSAHRISLAFTL
jgi:hypothetical protein